MLLRTYVILPGVRVSTLERNTSNTNATSKESSSNSYSWIIANYGGPGRICIAYDTSCVIRTDYALLLPQYAVPIACD